VSMRHVPQVATSRSAVSLRPLAFPSAGARSRRLPFRLQPIRSPYKPSETPPPPAVFVNREREMLELANYLTQPQEAPRLAVISGAAGVGKSALAISAAHSIAGHFRQGQIYIQMPWPRQSIQDLRSALTHAATAMKVPVTRFTAPDATAHTTSKPRRLLLLDGINETFDAATILTPGFRSCALILTSLEPRTDIGNHFSLELQPLTDDAASELLGALIGQARTEEDPAFIQSILAAAQGIPYLIHLAAASLKLRPGWRMEALASRIGNFPDVTRDGAKYVFDLSFAFLAESQRDVMLQLGSLGSGVFSTRQLYSAIGAADDRAITQSLHALARAGLIERIADERTARAAYRITGPTAEYIKSRLTLERQRPRADAAISKPAITAGKSRLAAPLHAAAIRNLYSRGMLEEALQAARNATTALREADETEVQSSLAESNEDGQHHPAEWSLSVESEASDSRLDLGNATAIQAELHMELCLDDSESLAKRAIMMRRPRPSPVPLRCLGIYARRLQAAESARKYLTAAKAAAEAEGNRAEIVHVLRELALTEALDGQPDVARDIITTARAICDELADGMILASVLWAHGAVLMHRREFDLAEQQLVESAAVASESGGRLWLAWANYERAALLLREGKPSHARDLAFRAMDDFTEMRHRYGTARCRFLTALALQREERWREAATEIADAVGTFSTCNDKWMEVQAIEVFSEVLRRGHPERKHEASALKTRAGKMLKSVAADRKNTAAYAERLCADADTAGATAGGVQSERQESK
jgi:hypothetical protein